MFFPLFHIEDDQSIGKQILTPYALLLHASILCLVCRMRFNLHLFLIGDDLNTLHKLKTS